MEKLFGKMVSTLSDFADIWGLRHKVILSNVANNDTPDFKASELTFSRALKSAGNLKVDLAQKHPAHFPGKKGKSSVNYEIKGTEEKVNLDKEMATLSENQLMFNTTMEILARKFKGLKDTLNQAK